MKKYIWSLVTILLLLGLLASCGGSQAPAVEEAPAEEAAEEAVEEEAPAEEEEMAEEEAPAEEKVAEEPAEEEMAEEAAASGEMTAVDVLVPLRASRGTGSLAGVVWR